jgi:hypothetical protein
MLSWWVHLFRALVPGDFHRFHQVFYVYFFGT